VDKIVRCSGVVRQKLVQSDTCEFINASSSLVCDESLWFMSTTATESGCQAACSSTKQCLTYTLNQSSYNCKLYTRSCAGAPQLSAMQKADSSCGGVVGQPNEQDAYVFMSDGCSKDKPFKCFDDSCSSNMLKCLEKRAGKSLASVDIATVEASVCGKGYVLCHDGTCAEQPSNSRHGVKCPIVPRCDRSAPYRCTDGSCSTQRCIAKPCGAGLRRCEDGTCRSKCPQFDGCPSVDKPFHCKSRACAATETECAVEDKTGANGEGTEYTTLRRRLLATETFLSSVQEVSICKTNCNADQKAERLILSIDPSRETTTGFVTRYWGRFFLFLFEFCFDVAYLISVSFS
jgi:hypothetical protein